MKFGQQTKPQSFQTLKKIRQQPWLHSFRPPGGMRYRLLYYPTEKDFAILGSETWLKFNEQAPGVEHTLDPETGMHITDTIDYGFIVSEKIDLELDDGAGVQLKAGDAYVIKGARHAWHNRYSTPCLFSSAHGRYP